jgi:5'-nucleotidase
MEVPHGEPAASADQSNIDTNTRNRAVQEIKEWQAIMDHLRSLPAKNPGELPVIPVDERAAEVQAIKVG